MRTYQWVLLGVCASMLLLVACGGSDSKPKGGGGTAVAVTTTVAATTVPPVPTPTSSAPVVPKETEDRLVAKIDQATALLTEVSKPGVISGRLDKNKYGVKDTSNLDLKQDETNARLGLEGLLGKDPTLDSVRGRPASSPPPEVGYLKAIKELISKGQWVTQGGTSATDPVRVVGVDRMLGSAIGVLAFYNPRGSYEHLLPTAATKDKFGPNQITGSDSGIINLPGWSDAYFLLVDVYREVLTIGPQVLAAR